MLQRSRVPPILSLIGVPWVLVTMSGQQTRALSQARLRRTKRQVKSLSSMDKNEMGIELFNAGYAFPAESLKTKSQMKEVLRLHREQTSQSSRGSYHIKGLSGKSKEELCELNRDQMILRLRGWAPPVTLAPKAVAKPRALAKPTVAPQIVSSGSGASSSWTTPSTATAAPTAAARPVPKPVAVAETFDMTPSRTDRKDLNSKESLAGSDDSDTDWTPLQASPNTIATLTAQQTGLRAREEALQQQQAAAMTAHQQQLAATTPAMPLAPADGWEPPSNAAAGGWVTPEL